MRVWLMSLIWRGLRQGDPLSPFFFMLVAECLKVMMNVMVDTGLLSEYNVGTQDALSVTHL